jgi:DNA-binding beta-propeller fold protein YncE
MFVLTAYIQTKRTQGRRALLPRLQELLFTAVLLSVTATLQSCVMSSERPVYWQAAESPLVWPDPPDPPRIEYLGTMIPGASGKGTGFAESIGSFITGREATASVKPAAVGGNPAGMVVIADSSIPNVYFADQDMKKSTSLNDKNMSVLRSPVGVAVSDAGEVFVSDSAAGRVFVYGMDRKLKRTLGESLLNRPVGIALNPAQDALYVVDAEASQVVIMDLQGNKLGAFGDRGTKHGQFNYPTYIATMPNGDLCITDSLNFRIQLFDGKGTFLSAFGKEGDGGGCFSRPKGLGVDNAGRIYVVDAAFEVVQIFQRDGTLLLAFGSSGTGPGQFTLPNGLYVDKQNKIYVADSFNKRIQVFRLMEIQS